MEWMAFTGEQSVEEELGLADAPGVVYAYTIDDRGNMNGKMIIKEFRTNALDDSGNKIKMELSALTSRTATLTVTTTTNDLYLVMFDVSTTVWRVRNWPTPSSMRTAIIFTVEGTISSSL